MSERIINAIQASLQTNIEKIDINDPALNTPIHPEQVDPLAQAAIPTILLGTLVKLTHIHPEHLMQVNGLSFEKVFGGKCEAVAQSIAAYAGSSSAQAASYADTGFEALNAYLHNELDGDIIALRSELESGQNSILSYLPAGVNMGNTLKLDTIDDRTHKMEGILSSLANYLFNEDIKTDATKK